MAENELEVRLEKKINALQQQINSLGVYIKRVHGQVTYPSTLARMKKYIDEPLAALQDKLNPWVDYSVTSTIVGWGAFTSKVLQYKKIDDMIFVVVYLNGTSNAVNATFTLPDLASISSISKCLHCMDNGQWRAVNGVVSLSASSNIATCTLDGDATTWSNANQKSIQGQFFYRTA
jgi:hypothetical protein